jgi:NAD(P)-dependent dehydrogenase (short-subunit alcohol dehydrogenase family)
MRLDGKIAIVAGAGQQRGETLGNGRATCLRFARAGARLILANRSLHSLEETRDVLEKEGFSADCMQADVSNEADCKALIERAVGKYGRLDVLHNNVGVAMVEGDTAKVERNQWDSILASNVTGAMLLTKAALPVMRAQKSGSITHVSSIAAVTSYPLVAYKASKAALHAFVRWVAFENAPHNIRCNAIMLGLMDTPIGIETYHVNTGTPRDEIRRQRNAMIPMGRMGSAWETASVALFLASEESSYVTGAIIPVDGGFTTRVG